MRACRVNIRRRRRRGTIYVLVLLSSLIVAAVGLSSLQLIRLQGRTASANLDFVAARSYARAAIDIGMLKIRSDPYWRTKYGNGNWLSNQAISTGKFSLSAVDPIDNDVTKGDNHPVVLTGIGMQGSAVFKTSARLEVGPRVGSCLEVSMTSGQNTTVSAATLTSDQWVSANKDFSSGGGATVDADVEAQGKISGSTYTKAMLAKTVARDMPDPANALNYYLTSGTNISYTSFPQWDNSQLLTNTDFETDVSGWYATPLASLQKSTTQVKSGTSSLRVSSRLSTSSVAAQDLPLDVLSSGNTYLLSMPIYAAVTGTARAVLTLTTTDNLVQTFTTPDFAIAKNSSGVYTWVDLKGNITPTWQGLLAKATVSIWTSFKNTYYMDKVSLTDVTYPAGAYVIDKQLISPTVNPYGSTNAKGIYIINCGGKDVVVGRSRVIGTLVFIRPGSKAAIQDSMSWEPAVYNYPALLTDQALEISLSSTGLSESTLGVNFNPPGSLFPFLGGNSDLTMTDTYPSRIDGLIYSADKLDISGTTNLRGVVVANSDIKVNATSLTLNYNNTYFNNPPPGFDIGAITMKVIPGTWQRAVD